MPKARPLYFCIAALVTFCGPASAEQATPADYAAVIRNVAGLNADGLETKTTREEYCKPLPADKLIQCRNHMETIGESRRKLDAALTTVDDAAKKGPVDVKVLQRLSAQVAAYVSLRNFIFLWLDDK